MISLLLLIVILAAVAFEFINGFHDTANAIATTVYTRALTVGKAILWAASLNFLGALVSESVAKTITSGLVAVDISEYVVLAALLAAIAWDLITWRLGIPSSSSHALIGGLVGATMAFTTFAGGGLLSGVQWLGLLNKVVIPLFTSPLAGFVIAFVLFKLLLWRFARIKRHHANRFFLRLQILSAGLMAFSHGTNDAQKTMGIITLAMVSAGLLPAAAGIPLWVKVLCGAVIAAGTAVGGWRVMKTMGNVTRLEPAQGFAAETASALVIEGMSALGAPVSTTQVISTAVIGVGSARRLRAVKWGMAKRMVVAWVITLPIAAALGAVALAIIELCLMV
jgi:PiT family inorganic phosphate transporter